MSESVIISPLPAFLLLITLLGLCLIMAFGKKPNIREFCTFVTAFTNFFIVCFMASTILDGKIIKYNLWTVAPGLELNFRVDALSMFMGLTASFLWIINSLYSIGYMRAHRTESETRFFGAFAVAIGASLGVAFSGSLFTLFIFYEILSISTYPLVAHNETDVSRAGARKYLTYLLGASIAFFLSAIFLTYYAAGTLTFLPGGILDGTASNTYITILFLFFIAGIAKSGIMPMHSWLPAAMVAPTPVSALLHAVAVVKVGVFSVVKILLYIFGVNLLLKLQLGTILIIIASFTILAASLIAMRQDNLKKRLAYSTVSQLSYIILGIALLSPAGIKSSLLHIFVHAFSKITLFFAAGSIYIASHKTNISEMAGIGWKMPWTMGAFTVGALSMIGIPPTAGLLSKWYLLTGSVEAGRTGALVVIVISTLLNTAYFMPIIYTAFFNKPDEESLKVEDIHGGHDDHGESPYPMVMALTATAVGTVMLFLFPQIAIDLANLVLETVI